jgi:hypothetical protein
MNILKDNCDSPLDYVISLFNTYCNKIIIKNKSKTHIQYLQKNLKKNNVPINEILFNQFPLFKFLKIPKFELNTPI